MDKRKVNEAISSWFEPKPTWNWDNAKDQWLPSAGGAWMSCGIRGSEEPLNYFTDEAANARLLEAMPFVRLQIEVTPKREWWCTPHLGHSDYEVDSDRKTAIVMAFLQFAGIETASPPAEGE